jgi:hypothetical protein
VPDAAHFSQLQQRINVSSLYLKKGNDLVSETMCLKILNDTKQYPKYFTYTVEHAGLLGCDTSTGGVISSFSVASAIILRLKHSKKNPFFLDGLG